MILFRLTWWNPWLPEPVLVRANVYAHTFEDWTEGFRHSSNKMSHRTDIWEYAE